MNNHSKPTFYEGGNPSKSSTETEEINIKVDSILTSGQAITQCTKLSSVGTLNLNLLGTIIVRKREITQEHAGVKEYLGEELKLVVNIFCDDEKIVMMNWWTTQDSVGSYYGMVSIAQYPRST